MACILYDKTNAGVACEVDSGLDISHCRNVDLEASVYNFLADIRWAKLNLQHTLHTRPGYNCHSSKHRNTMREVGRSILDKPATASLLDHPSFLVF
jgi:hypothetical protein